ncbi:MAG: hypothetical protein Aurels2KO_20810 [Aureliella sp.]
MLVLLKSLTLAVSASCLAALLLFLFSDPTATYLLGKPELAPVLRWLAPGIVGLSVIHLTSMTLQGIRRISASVLVVNIAANLLLAAGVYLFAADSAVDAACMFSMICAFVSAGSIGLAYLLRPSGGGSVDWSTLTQSCGPLWIVAILTQLTQLSGQLIAGAWVDASELAQLVVAQRTATLASLVLIAVNLVAAPRFAAMFKAGDMLGVQNLAITSVRAMLLIAAPMLILMLALPGLPMSLFGDGFRSGAHLLQILAVGQFVNVATGSVGYLLMMSGNERAFRNTVLVSGPMAILGALSLTPVLGATGAAIATALSMAAQNLLAVWWVRKHLGFNTLAIW